MRLRVTAVELFERDVLLRMPFRFGVVTLTQAPQAFARVRIRVEDGREAEGAAAELLAPKWFDKDPALSNEDNFDQLRRSLAQARAAYLAHEARTAWGHAAPARGLVENFGPALLDRALLDALCRALGVSFFEAIRRNLVGAPAVDGIDLGAYFATLRPAARIAARHTVGLLDPVTAVDCRARVGDGLPETLEEVVARYGHRYFKLKVGGDARVDVARLAAIAAVLDRIGQPYHVTLDGNEQYEDFQGVAELWAGMHAEPRLARLAASVLFVEQPVKRQKALTAHVSGLERPVIIDESDDAMDAFPRARALGYRGVSSKTCKGVYRALVNGARCAAWNRKMGSDPIYFLSGEDLTQQAGLALQQDTALVSLLGLTHVERNGHHYVNGMAGLPAAEQEAFLGAHPDLYDRSHGAVRVRIAGGMLDIGSLACAGFASGAMPDWVAMREMKLQKESA
ncbi:MAG: mandelate racemase [Betaproteobacteria bacterium]|nr:mandelate racemase [Betaproteobacteria bacterium]MDH5221825.1 mandelate racemase [Betaproteobacteria bacterium]MDH5350629.1 mandelate racemase [Betaproteobacteria bacterium]